MNVYDIDGEKLLTEMTQLLYHIRLRDYPELSKIYRKVRYYIRIKHELRKHYLKALESQEKK